MRLSLHMMILNGAKNLERALAPLVGIVDEVCYTDTGSTDGTHILMRDLCTRFGFRLNGTLINPINKPDFYFNDFQSSFNFRFPDQSVFSNLPQLRDWSKARNLSLNDCQAPYVLRIDADDQVLRPENLLPTLDMLDDYPTIDFVFAPYEIMLNSSLSHTISHHFIWRNLPTYRFSQVLHEHIPGRKVDGSNWLVAQSGLLFRDWRDSTGLGARVPHRNFKVLLLEYERCLKNNIPVPGHVRLTLADEGVAVDPEFAHRVLGEPKDFPQAMGWAHYIRGECYLRMGMRLVEPAFREFSLSARQGDLRGLLRFGHLQKFLGAGDYRATFQELLRKRQTAISCLIPSWELDKVQAQLEK